MASEADPDYYQIISRETIEALADGSDAVAIWAHEMRSAKDEEQIFLRGARAYFASSDQLKQTLSDICDSKGS